MANLTDPNTRMLLNAGYQSNQYIPVKRDRRWMSFFSSRVVSDTACASLPASPVEGQAVIIAGGTNANAIARYSTELAAWEYLTPWAGLTVQDATGASWSYSGSVWAARQSGGGSGGILVGRASASRSDMATGTTIIPSDDTIPQITEGTQFLTLNYTPKLASSLIVATVDMNYAISTNSGWLIGALFRGSATDAIAAVIHSQYNAWPGRLSLRAELSNTDGSLLALSFRAGLDVAGTMTMNGVVAARKLGGVARSWIRVEEFAP